MLRQMLVAVVVAGAVGAPAAVADSVRYDCGFDAVSQDFATGGLYEGVGWGWVSHPNSGLPDAVSITVRLRVNGVEVMRTPPATGLNHAAGAWRVTFQADDTDVVDAVCEATTGHGTETKSASGVGSLPPNFGDELIENVLDLVRDLIVDDGTSPETLICASLRAYVPTVDSLEATTHVHVDEDDCDIWYAGEKVIDFTPYDDEEHARR